MKLLAAVVRKAIYFPALEVMSRAVIAANSVIIWYLLGMETILLYRSYARCTDLCGNSHP